MPEEDWTRWLTEGERDDYAFLQSRVIKGRYEAKNLQHLRSLAEARRETEEEKGITATAIDEMRRAEQERGTAIERGVSLFQLAQFLARSMAARERDVRRCMEAGVTMDYSRPEQAWEAINRRLADAQARASRAKAQVKRLRRLLAVCADRLEGLDATVGREIEATLVASEVDHQPMMPEEPAEREAKLPEGQ